KYPLCHRCFGRLYAKLLHTSNYERGKSLKIVKAIELESKLLTLMEKYNELAESEDREETEECSEIKLKIESEIKKIKEQLKYRYKSGLTEIKLIDMPEEINKEEKKVDLCPWCKNIFSKENLEIISEKVIDLLKDYEYETFLVGTMLPKNIKELEKELETPYMESIRQEFNRVMGKMLVEKTGKIVDKNSPDIVIMINPYNRKIKLQINPIFIKGRYRKLLRGIPQTHWPCRYCRGKGCEKCNYTGKQYPTSVEEIIAEPFMKAFKGRDEAFHGAGREDIDVRMLGNGRPFVLQIKEPKIRKADLEKLKEEVNKSGKVEILNLDYGVRKDVVFFKNEPHKKTYLAIVECEEDVNDDEISKLVVKLENLTINQRTPIRVSHRRADLVRVRKVYKARANRIDSKTFELTLYCDGGLYIKELISGDEGRTSPSVSEILNKKCICKTLDVLDVHDMENGEN
uniref:tRNA pseudouridine(54/55) synthase Pus10 n=1 Tax=Methanothermococcus sp. TaxID=2614238 RepID=UPI0025E63C84